MVSQAESNRKGNGSKDAKKRIAAFDGDRSPISGRDVNRTAKHACEEYPCVMISSGRCALKPPVGPGLAPHPPPWASKISVSAYSLSTIWVAVWSFRYPRSSSFLAGRASGDYHVNLFILKLKGSVVVECQRPLLEVLLL